MSDEHATRLLQEAIEQRYSRREVIKRGAALGLSMPVIGIVLAACGGGASPTAATGGGAQPAATTATGAANPSFIDEDPQFFHVLLPSAGVCQAGTRNVYRTFSNRADANHRYMVDSAIRDHMVTTGWLAEGDGPDLVVMCAPL